MDALKKILITYANSGAGHRRAAEALNCVVKDYFPNADVRLMDVLDYTSPIFRKSYPQFYLFMVKHSPWLWGWMFHIVDNQLIDGLARNFRRFSNSFYGKEFIKFLLREKPDLIISTHFLANELISIAKKRYQFKTFLATCVTDYYPHAWWKDSGVDQYIIPSQDLEARLVKIGIKATKIKTIGIPIDPVFEKQMGKAEVRAKLGLKKDQFTILITSGGFGVGPVRELVVNIRQIKVPLQVIVVCGNNPKLQDDLTDYTKKSIHNFRVYGFIDNMHEFMEASDIMISKSGGLTSSEAMAKGLPLITFKPIPGQESGNCRFLLKHHAGLLVRNARQARLAMEKLLNDPEQLQLLKENMRKLGHPQAASETVAYIKEILDNSKENIAE